MKKAAIFLADGFEEVEGLTVTDILRRAGIRADHVSVTGKREVTGSHGIVVMADTRFEDGGYEDADLLVLPGGMPGTLNLKAHAGLAELLEKFYTEGRYIGAICAAPTVFGELGFLKGRRACCYPGMEDGLTGADVTQDAVAVDGNVVTSRGVGTAISFALKLTALLAGDEKAEEIRKSIVYAEKTLEI